MATASGEMQRSRKRMLPTTRPHEIEETESSRPGAGYAKKRPYRVNTREEEEEEEEEGQGKGKREVVSQTKGVLLHLPMVRTYVHKCME